MSQKRKYEPPTAVQEERRTQVSILIALINKLKDGQDVLRQQIEDLQTRTAAIENFLAEDEDDPECSQETNSELG